MKTTTIAAALAIALLAADTSAQRRMRNLRNNTRTPEEIQNRVGVFFTDTAGPATEGDKVADLATCEMVRAAIAARQLTVLYLIDQQIDAKIRRQFERTLFESYELGIELRAFHCGRIDLAKDQALAERFGEKAPLFVVFDEKGKPIEVSMAGYRPSITSLTNALEKSASGAMKPALPAFAKHYRGIVKDLEKVLLAKQEVEQERDKAVNEAERRKARKELEKLATAEQKLLDKEQKLLEGMRLPIRPAGAQRLGARGRDRSARGAKAPAGAGGATGKGSGGSAP